ncbi:MAG TPA: hypothetical protein VMX38_21195 [Verrucomicrobiae bacterium]|nr:hypothetical protein [Verrucomicrobiae bacterium]
MFAVLIAALPAHSQAPTLGEQLAAQYKLTRMGADSTGTSVVEEGTLLAVQKGGIIGTPYKSVSTRTATYQDGTVHASDVTHNATAQKVGKLFCGLHKCPSTPDAASDENATKLFKVGDKVYATKIDVNNDKDQVIMGIVACDTCNKTDPPTYNKANVVFQFAKGSLASTPASTIEDTIGQVFTISDNNSQDQGGQQQSQDQGQGQGQGQGQQQQQQTETQTVQMGMTTDQVVGTLGKPDQQFNVGPKQIFVYKTAGIKVTFFGGKVVDVQ